MSEIETVRVSTQLDPGGHLPEDFLRTVGSLTLAIQMRNMDMDLDWATARLDTEVNVTDITTFGGEYETVTNTVITLEVQGVRDD